METKLKNGNKIPACDATNKDICGNRSKIIGARCYDIETGQWIFMEWDASKPTDRYIPGHMFLEWTEAQEDKHEITKF